MSTLKTIPDKLRLKVLKRDNFTCKSCGKSPALYPELEINVVKLEVDHFKPFSKGGTDELENLQTLCILCNRGKGDDESLNNTIENKIEILLNKINPEILKEIEKSNIAKVVANDADYQELSRLNDLCDSFKIEVIPNTINGYHAGYKMGIYTIYDNNGSKVNFLISKI